VSQQELGVKHTGTLGGVRYHAEATYFARR
jgi:hypothetical protein